MATAADIDQLRAFVNEPSDEDPYSDTSLTALIDAMGVREAAAQVWRQKAAAVADLVNVSESGSSRSLGSLYTQYLAMAKEFGDTSDTGSDIGRPRTTRIVRA